MKNNIIPALVTLCLLTACATKTYAPGEIPVTTLESQEISRQFSYSLTENFKDEGQKVSSGGAAHSRVVGIMNKLFPAADLPKNSLPVLIVEDEQVNAAIYDGKTVVVNSGLLTFVKNNDELAAVLAHELGHALAKHHEDKSGETRASTVGVLSSVLGTVAGVATTYYTGSGSAGDAVSDVTETGTEIVGYGAYVQSYNRDQERQADDIGLNLMTKAGYKPEAAVALWQRMAEVHGTQGGFFSSHPSNPERAGRIEEKIPAVKAAYLK